MDNMSDSSHGVDPVFFKFKLALPDLQQILFLVG